MVRRVAWLISVSLWIGLLWPVVAFAAGPEPTASPAPSPTPDVSSGTLLVAASVEIAKKLVDVGLWLVVVAFIATLLASFFNAPAIKKAIDEITKKAIQRLPVRKLGDGEQEPPAIPYGDLFRGMFSAITDLIRTPVGVGMALIVLAVVLLISQAAISGGFTESGSVLASEAPTSSPAATEAATDSPATDSPATDSPATAGPSPSP